MRLSTALLLALLYLAGPLSADELLHDWQRSVQDNQLDFIRRHLERMENIDHASERGKTALMAAAGEGAADLVRSLLKRGADVNAHTQSGGTALIYAASGGSVETAGLLLEYGARLDQQSGNGWTALMMAAAKDHSAIAELLMQRGADANLTDIYGWTALMRAVYEGHSEVARTLLRYPATAVGRCNEQGQTALHLAVIQAYPALAELLLAHGAHPDSEDFSGLTPRSISLVKGDERMIALLAREGERPQ